MHTMLIESRRRKQRKMNRVRQIAAESKKQLDENEPATTPTEPPPPASPPVQEPEPIEPPNLPTDPHDLAHELQQEPKDQEATDEALENVEEKKRGKPKQRR